MKSKIIILLIALFVLTLTAPFAIGAPSLTNFTDHVHILTTGGTATPGLMVNQRGTGKIFELKDNGTPVFAVNDGGGIIASSILTQGAVITNLVVSAPTAVGTATPAAVINNAGVSNLLEVRDSSTPVFTVGQAGAVTGLVLQYATSGQRQFCATNTITDTASYTSSTTAVATPVFTWCTLADITGDANNCAATHGVGIITVTIKNSAATPAANAAGASVTWCVVGTP